MNAWIIEPRDSLIVRDGRPFGLGAGLHATSLDFPFPSTTTGGFRTRAGLDDQGVFDSRLIAAVKEIDVAGPLLVALNEKGDIDEWLMPAPSDALLTQYEDDKQKANIRRLAPMDVAKDWTSLCEVGAELLPVGWIPKENIPRQKPLDAGPRYWHWDRFKEWLIDAKDKLGADLADLGHSGPVKDSRIHVSIDPHSLTAGDGELFQTRGLEFRRVLNEEKSLKKTQRLAMVVLVDDSPQAKNVKRGLAPLGGERRLVAWREYSNDGLKEIRDCPAEIKDQIVEQRHCRLVLLTPAFFKLGSYPEWLLLERYSITPKLKAMAHNRYQVVSGWDFAKVSIKGGKTILGEPKPTRRLVPSGAVFFLELDGDEDSRRTWVEKTWLSCVSDDVPGDQQDCRKDGFGLAMLGTWDGKLLDL